MDLRNVTVRKFRTEDAKRVARIIEENRRQEQEQVNSAEAVTPKFVLSQSNKSKMYVALDEETIVGTASLDYDTIHTVYVALQHQGEGIEGKLVGLLEEIVANQGLRVTKLIAEADAQRFYERLGYRRVEAIAAEPISGKVYMDKYLV